MDPVERDWFLNALVDKDANTSSKLKFQQNKCCSFLSKDDLCEIQVKYDQSYLPTICRTFPRTTIQTKQIAYETAWFSCPEIARLVLEGEADTDPFMQSQINVSNDLLEDVIMNDTSLFAMLDDWQISVLNLDKFPLGLRIFFLASVYAQLVQRTQTGNLSKQDIETLRHNTHNNLYEMNLVYKQGRLSPDPVTAGSYWKVITELCAACKIDPAFMAGGEGQLHMAILSCDGSHESYAGVYEVVKHFKQNSQALIREVYTNTLKLFLRNYFAAIGFPLQPVSSTHGITFIKCLSGLCMLQLLLWLAVQRKAELSPQLLQDLVVEVHRKYIHNNTTEKRLKEDPHMQNFAAYSICAVDLF